MVKKTAGNEVEKPGAEAETAAVAAVEEPYSADVVVAGAKLVAESRTARNAVRDLPRVMTRLFGKPLMVSPEKLEAILAGLGPRLGIEASPLASDKQADAIGAFLDDDDENDEGTAQPFQMLPDGIALISVEGTLVYKSSWLGALSGLVGYGDIRSSLDAAVADDAVKGILLQVDSYGGEVNGCFDLSDAVFEARAKKPIYGVAADDSFSAAYALLSACSKVFVSRTSGVGSVGVVALHVDQSAADKERGLKYTYVFSGDRKIDGNPHQPLSTPALQNLQSECDRMRALFAASVAKYRGLSVDDVVATEAKCFFGEHGISAKFADAMGTPADALAALRADIASKAIAGNLIEGGTPVTAEPAGTLIVDGNIASAIITGLPVAKSVNHDVVDLDAVRREVRGESAKDHGEIVELCALADEPQLAAEFIRTGKSIAQVREQLQMRRAEASDARKISGHILPDAGDHNPKADAAGWDKAIVAVRGKLKEH